MRQIRILGPSVLGPIGSTPIVLGSVGRELVATGVAEWVIEAPAAAPAGPAAKAAPKRAAKKTSKRRT